MTVLSQLQQQIFRISQLLGNKMTRPSNMDYAFWLDGIALAARAHQGQLRKDQRTPYVSHVFRVAMIARDVFGCEDPLVLTAAVLHDTIEDTTTDYDGIEEAFGAEVARRVAALTKNKSRGDQIGSWYTLID
jgi:(p)ppGpp synthase/HD superfamily hydrolase